MTTGLRAILLMVAAMAAFALEDMFIKLMADSLPVGQILALLGAGGALIFGGIALAQGARLFSADAWNRGVLWRTLGEVIGTVGFVSAITLTPISSATAIFQAMPLAVTMGAALFLGEKVGWRRWSAIIVGFAGVLIVVRPGMAGFSPLSLLAVVGVIGLAARDIATRAVPAQISSMQLSSYAFLALVPTGAAMMAVAGEAWAMPAPQPLLWLGLAQLIGVGAYAMLVAATRTGDMSVVAPFRYARLLFALVIAVTVFGEPLDAPTLVGAAIIVGSGIYAFMRQASRDRQARAASLAGRDGQARAASLAGRGRL